MTKRRSDQRDIPYPGVLRGLARRNFEALQRDDRQHWVTTEIDNNDIGKTKVIARIPKNNIIIPPIILRIKKPFGVVPGILFRIISVTTQIDNQFIALFFIDGVSSSISIFPPDTSGSLSEIYIVGTPLEVDTLVFLNVQPEIFISGFFGQATLIFSYVEA